MAPTRKLAFTPSADVIWSGEVVPCFRISAEGATKTKLTDAAWLELRHIIRGYSMLLSHEYAAAPLTLQREAARDLVVAISALQNTIERVDTHELGLIVSSRIADEWSTIWDRSAEYERGRQRMVASMVATFGAGDPLAEEKAWALLGEWEGMPPLVHPSQPQDLVADLHVFRDAARSFSVGLDDDSRLFDAENDAWINLIGQLAEWGERHGVKLWASKSGTYGSSGTFTALAEAINEQVPVMLDATGRRAGKQIRRPKIESASLASAIIAARKKYEARGDAGDQ